MTDDLACIELVELITDYLDGALPAEETRRVEEHLPTCPGCTEYVAQMRALAGGLGDAQGEGLSPGARERLLDEFRRRV